MDRYRDYEVFLQYLFVAVAANCKNSSESDKLLVNEMVSVTRLLLVTVRCTWLIRLVRLIMMRFVRSKRLMSDDELDKDCEVHQADE